MPFMLDCQCTSGGEIKLQRAFVGEVKKNISFK
jgi:hypothetical protein